MNPASARCSASCALLALLFAACGVREAPTFAATPAQASDGHFAVIGDVQGTLPEELLIGREDNERERWRLLPELARDTPAFVILLGDLVAWGASESAWQDFDRRTERLRKKGIPVLAVPGNHDYYGGDHLRHYFARFPFLQGQRWYERGYGPLGLIFLDSNAGPLSAAEWLEQRAWYEETLRRFDEDPSVRGVLVFMHHAPFTNSSRVGDDPHVIDTLLPAFVGSRKTMALVTGHAHGYERFRGWGKSFIVSGGGGGPRAPLLSSERRRHVDQFFGPELRNFNFLELTVRDGSLHVDAVGLPRGERHFCLMESFELGWPTANGTSLALAPEPPTTARELLPRCYGPR